MSDISKELDECPRGVMGEPILSTAQWKRLRDRRAPRFTPGSDEDDQDLPTGIQITPAMVEAGVEAWIASIRRSEAPATTVAHVFERMTKTTYHEAARNADHNVFAFACRDMSLDAQISGIAEKAATIAPRYPERHRAELRAFSRDLAKRTILKWPS